MIVGITKYSHPSSSAGGQSNVLPGSNIRAESQMSPRTLANEVNISAKTTSAKWVGVLVSGSKQRLSALVKVSVVQLITRWDEQYKFASF